MLKKVHKPNSRKRFVSAYDQVINEELNKRMCQTMGNKTRLVCKLRKERSAKLKTLAGTSAFNKLK